MLISVAIPCYRSSKTLPAVVEEICHTISEKSGYDYQIILVNDGSPDNTIETIRQLCQMDPKIVGVNLSRNNGQANARMAAFEYIEGDVAVFMDDDGQHPACEMFRLIEKIEEGYDLVTGYFSNTSHSAMQKITSRMSAFVFERSGKRPKGAVSSSYFAINRLMIDAIKGYTCPFPSVFGYMYQITNRIAKVEIPHRERASGKSGYTFQKRLKLFIRSMVNFSMVLLQFMYSLAAFCGILGCLVAVGVLVFNLYGKVSALGLWLLAALMLVLTAVILLGMALMGEYIGRTYLLISGQPRYLVREVINYSNSPKEEK